MDAAVNTTQLFKVKSRQFTWYNFGLCCLISLAPFSFGYCAAIVGSTLGQPAFLIYMKLVDPETSQPTKGASALEGAMSSVFWAGALCGVSSSSFVSDNWGRKAGLLYAATFAIVGAALCCAAQNIAMFISFRFVMGFCNAFVPVGGVYTSELAPPAMRGFFGGVNGFMILAGYSTASFMGLAFYQASNPIVQWRTPLGLAVAFPLLMILVLPLLPESPRWLLLQGREAEAERIIHRLHEGRDNGEFAHAEFALMQRQARKDASLDSSWKVIFSHKPYRKCALISIGIGVFGQASGVSVINNFSALIYHSLGFNNEKTLILLCGWIAGGMPASLIGAWLMDVWGRRPMITSGFAGVTVLLAVLAALIGTYATPLPASPNESAMGAAVAMLYMFIWIFSGNLDNALVVYLPELFPTHLRAKGVTLGILAVDLTDLILAQCTPIALRQIGWRLYLVFLCCATVAFFLSLAHLKETKGIPLEKIAELFGETVGETGDVSTDANQVSKDDRPKHLEYNDVSVLEEV